MLNTDWDVARLLGISAGKIEAIRAAMERAHDDGAVRFSAAQNEPNPDGQPHWTVELSAVIEATDGLRVWARFRLVAEGDRWRHADDQIPDWFKVETNDGVLFEGDVDRPQSPKGDSESRVEWARYELFAPARQCVLSAANARLLTDRPLVDDGDEAVQEAARQLGITGETVRTIRAVLEEAVEDEAGRVSILHQEKVDLPDAPGEVQFNIEGTYATGTVVAQFLIGVTLDASNRFVRGCSVEPDWFDINERGNQLFRGTVEHPENPADLEGWVRYDLMFAALRGRIEEAWLAEAVRAVPNSSVDR